MPEDHGPQHYFLGKLLGLGFDHQHGGFGAGNDEIELGARRELGLAWIEDVLSVDIADARRADGAVEGHAR